MTHAVYVLIEREIMLHLKSRSFVSRNYREVSGIYDLCISLVITGARKKDVLSCRHKIELITESSRHKIPPTHFLSFPLYNMEIISRLEEFKNTALETCRQVINKPFLANIKRNTRRKIR